MVSSFLRSFWHASHPSARYQYYFCMLRALCLVRSSMARIIGEGKHIPIVLVPLCICLRYLVRLASSTYPNLKWLCRPCNQVLVERLHVCDITKGHADAASHLHAVRTTCCSFKIVLQETLRRRLEKGRRPRKTPATGAPPHQWKMLFADANLASANNVFHRNGRIPWHAVPWRRFHSLRREI